MEKHVQQNASLQIAHQTTRVTESWKVITNKTCRMHAVQLNRLLIRKHQKKRDHTEDLCSVVRMALKHILRMTTRECAENRDGDQKQAVVNNTQTMYKISMFRKRQIISSLP
jgi:hypothetical protein